MTFSPTNRQIVLQELFDEDSEPTIEEIEEYALKIGIDIENEDYLLPFARHLLLQPLPAGWSPCCDGDVPEDIYYFNFKTGRAQWVHPLEDLHRCLVKQARGDSVPSTEQLEDDSRTSLKEDSKSFEEADIMLRPRALAPLKLNSSLDIKKVTFDESEVKKRPNSSDIRNRRNIEALELRHLSKQDIMTSRSPWRDEGYATESSAKELTLSGGGSMFLKKSCNNPPLDLSPKGILRKDSLEDTDTLFAHIQDKEEEDERKSVRFNLEKEIKVNFEVPDTPSVSQIIPADLKLIELDFEDLNIDMNLSKDFSNPSSKSVSLTRAVHDPIDHLIDLSDSLLLKPPTPVSLVGNDEKVKEVIPQSVAKASGNEDDIPLLVNVDNSTDKARNNLEVAKAEILKQLEGDFNVWVKNTEKTFKDKEKQYYNHIKEKFEDWKKNQDNELIKWCAEEREGKLNCLRNQMSLEQQEAIEALTAQLSMQHKQALLQLRNELQAKEDMELAALRQALADSLAQKKHALHKEYAEQVAQLVFSEQKCAKQVQMEHETTMVQRRAQLSDTFLQEKMIAEQEHETALNNLRHHQQTQLRQMAAALKKQTKEESLRLERVQTAIKQSADPRLYEKLRCEKRLLEDKYKGLKEKYIRLKSEMKSSLEKRSKQKEIVSTSETDKSVSHNLTMLKEQVPEDSSGDDHEVVARRRRHLFSKLKAASTSRLNSPDQPPNKDDVVSPVENLRRQLKKLEELEDEFPASTHTDTYLRYPFTDSPSPHLASSELEFFKHRIHLERDSVRRAKEFLKTQKKCYEKRQLELQHRLRHGGPSSKTIVHQIYQEERELTEMEVSVHRTRALLGEKIIRLRHLEQSLRRVSSESRVPKEDPTLSDLSSHSDSSGFSSTHHTSEPPGTHRHLHNGMQEPSEIIQSLENLNSEIRGIWQVLKQQSSGSTGTAAASLPPPPLAWPAVRTNPSASLPVYRPVTSQLMTQVSAVGHVTTIVDSSLVERTKSLRDWLKSARPTISPGDSTVAGQVTL